MATTRYTVALKVRVTPGEHAAIREQAQAAGLSLSRYLAATGATSEGVRVLASDARQELELIAWDLRKATVNLNQIARHLNRGEPALVSEFEAVRRHLEGLHEQVRKTLAALH